MNLPSTFISNIQAVHGEDGKTWLKRLPAHLEELSKLWKFQLIQPLPHLTYNFVGIVQLDSTEKKAVLKTSPQGEPLISEYKALQCFRNGVPKILKWNENKCAFLMEYIQPGHSLKTLVQKGQDQQATRLIAQSIRTLHTEQLKSSSFKHLTELAKSLDHLKGQLENRLLSKAETLFRELSADRTQEVILHGDLHHDNIICHGTEWRVIDPHGYIGDPAAEVGPMIRNPIDCFPKDRPLSETIETRLKILAEELPFDPQRIQAWTFCMTLLSAAWNMEDFGTTAKTEIELAAAINSIHL